MYPNRNLYLSLFCGQDSRGSQRGSIRTERKHLRTSGDCLKAIQRLGILQWGKSGHPSANVLSVRFTKQPREGVWVLLSSSLSWNTAVSALSGHFWPCAYPINKVQEVSHGPRWKPSTHCPTLKLYVVKSPFHSKHRQTLCWVVGRDQVIQELHAHQDDQKRKTVELKGIYGLSGSRPSLYRGRNQTSEWSEILFPRMQS